MCSGKFRLRQVAAHLVCGAFRIWIPKIFLSCAQLCPVAPLVLANMLEFFDFEIFSKVFACRDLEEIFLGGRRREQQFF
jgi:hypothetical protein